MKWIWEHPDWPNYQYDIERYTDRINEFQLKSARLFGRVEALPRHDQTDAMVDLMLSEAIKTSAIEGESLDRDSVRSSILALMGSDSISISSDQKAAGAAALMVDVRKHWAQSLGNELLGHWQSLVIAEQPTSTIMRGKYRNDPAPMQIVSGHYGKNKVHYEALPATKVPVEMDSFITWYNQSSPLTNRNPIPGAIRAGIAHAWFENIHPFDDGNGRVGRAIADHALSQSLGYPSTACLATAIEQNKKTYYYELEQVGKGDLNLNRWLDYFLDAINIAQDIAKDEIDFILNKTRFYDRFSEQMNDRQKKMIARVFAEGIKGFEGGISTGKYNTITKCSRATALRDLTDMIEKGLIIQLPGGGRSTRYELTIVEPNPLLLPY